MCVSIERLARSMKLLAWYGHGCDYSVSELKSLEKETRLVELKHVTSLILPSIAPLASACCSASSKHCSIPPKHSAAAVKVLIQRMR